MRVLQVCAEIFPLLKTGGLADVAGALPAALQAQGADVRVLLPGFAPILAGLADPVEVAQLSPPAAMAASGARLLRGRLPACAADAYVIDAPGYYHRAGGPYADADHQPYADNHLRFALLGWTAAALAQGLDPHWTPEAVHTHDWHAALAPAYLRAAAQARRQRMPGSVYTVHNLAYQGLFDARHFGELGLPGHFFAMHGMEFHGQLNFMKAGLYYADRISTVSPTYAREIQGPEQGCGLDGLLRERALDLSGILNGVDEAVWNPATDRLLTGNYDAAGLDRKAGCKAALQRELGLQAAAGAPIFCVVSRLTEQKGLHLVLQALPALVARGAQFALLGSGDHGLEAAFRAAADDDPDAVAVRLGYDEAFAHRLIAGSDVIMVPSRFEPCGLTQLYGLKYGTLPLVRRVGGLADTVADTRLETLDTDATGFVFDDFSAGGLLQAAHRALALYRRAADWRQVQRRAMSRPCGWDVAAARYLALYRQAAG
ncbi:glycogen synthase GlgA [Thauera sinica]|uniref:Glycogen synthase n=1 Tax=Thauera sinica TaxID=2665146 RepID=A0ABW1AR33_9RHOO|nr:glycogen synthase GlgA [Thauera sp. K11]ATE62537.1 glycogen synthase GlgA [Thauera sp. K11]